MKLVADDNLRETLTKIEQLGSALSDDVVSLFIRLVKSPKSKRKVETDAQIQIPKELMLKNVKL